MYILSVYQYVLCNLVLFIRFIIAPVTVNHITMLWLCPSCIWRANKEEQSAWLRMGEVTPWSTNLEGKLSWWFSITNIKYFFLVVQNHCHGVTVWKFLGWQIIFNLSFLVLQLGKIMYNQAILTIIHQHIIIMTWRRYHPKRCQEIKLSDETWKIVLFKWK